MWSDERTVFHLPLFWSLQRNRSYKRIKSFLEIGENHHFENILQKCADSINLFQFSTSKSTWKWVETQMIYRFLIQWLIWQQVMKAASWQAHTLNNGFHPPLPPLSGKWVWVWCVRKRRVLFCWTCSPATWWWGWLTHWMGDSLWREGLVALQNNTYTSKLRGFTTHHHQRLLEIP